MNKFTSLGIILFILSIQTSLFSQTRAESEKGEKAAKIAATNTDHNDTANSGVNDMALRLEKAKSELNSMLNFGERNPNAETALLAEVSLQITELRALVEKLEKALGIN